MDAYHLRRRIGKVLRWVLIYGTVLVWGFIVLFPFYWLGTTAFKARLDVQRGPKYLPYEEFEPTNANWDEIFVNQRSSTERYFRNSLIAATGSMFFSVLIGSMAGYALSRFTYNWRYPRWRNNNIAFWIISQRFLPPALFVVPYVILYGQLGLIDTHGGLILAYTLFNVPFAVWIMRDFFNNLPVELEDSARVDGASRLQAFTRIVLPLSAPGLVAVAIFAFIFSWNEYLYALMLTNFEAITMPVLIAGQNSTRGIEWGYISVLALTAIFPVVLIGLFLERFITRGLVAGALKG